MIATRPSAKLISRPYRLMGNQFQIGIVWEDEKEAEEFIEKAVVEIQRIEKKFTTYCESSETYAVNKNAGIESTLVSKEFFDLVKRCLALSNITQGAFDISYGGIDDSLWNFKKDIKTLPSKEEAKKSIHLINYQNILLDETNHSIFLKEKGMKIGFGGIGKGYAAEMAKNILKNLGIENGIVNASGDIVVWGQPPKGEKWSIGIIDPNLKQSIFSQVKLRDCAVATSGNYEKFAIIDGIKYSHTIDPKTGFPIRGIKSVTVICEHGEMADALTTPIMVMGIDSGLYLVNQLNGIECIIIDDNDCIHTSKNINLIK